MKLTQKVEGIWIQWNGMVDWNGMVEWNGGEIESQNYH